jgi:hypothetical protein
MTTNYGSVSVGLQVSGADVGTGNPMPILGPAGVASANFTTPASNAAYSVGDLVANSATAGLVTPLVFAIARASDKSVVIPRVRVKTTDAAFAAATVRLHIFENSPTLTVGDNGVFAGGCTESKYLGFCDIILDRHFSDCEKGFGIPSVGSCFVGLPDTGTQQVYGLLETRTAIASPGLSQTWTAVVEAVDRA